jgi:WD40 repeat protein
VPHDVPTKPTHALLATGIQGGRIALWDVAEGRLRMTFRGHSLLDNPVAIAPDGATLASAGKDGAIRLWHLPGSPTGGGKPAPPLVLVHTIDVHKAQVWFATFAPDGKTVATGSGDTTVRLWDTATMKPRGILKGHAFGVSLGLFAAGGKSLITSGIDRTIRVWDFPSMTERRKLTGHMRSVTFIALAPDGKRVASASEDRTVKLWDLATGAELRSFPEQPALVNGVAFSPDGKTLAAAVGDRRTDQPGFVKLWDVDTGQERSTLTGFRLTAWKVTFAPNRP